MLAIAVGLVSLLIQNYTFLRNGYHLNLPDFDLRTYDDFTTLDSG